ncbi:MAG: Wzz/FepE/Etk N-terminal domain-containing protein [Sediminibacterium sp.]|nr:Wzz/FepE/Etk N-terminal domain-containing protein [Sediminibacterium sp.]
MSENIENQNNSSDEIDIKEVIIKLKGWLLYLKSKWIILTLMGFIGCVIGFGYAYMQKPTYTATLTFALEDEKNGSSGLGGALGLASSFGLDLGTSAGGAFSGANLIELMKSRRLVEQSLLNPVIVEGKQISLAEMYIQNNGWRKKWEVNPDVNRQLQFLPATSRDKFTLEQDSVLGIIFSNLTANNLIVSQKDKKVSIITIEVQASNELFSKYFAEILAKEVSDFYIETKSKKAKLNLSILERQADSIRAELYNAITGVALANDKTYNLNPALIVRRTPSARRQVDVQANTAILTELVKNLEMARVTVRKETPLIQIIDRPILPLLKESVSKRKSTFTGGFFAGVIILVVLIGNSWWKKQTTEV